MSRVVHVIGNGDSAAFYQKEPRKGLKLTCNIPPFEVKAYATCIVDFKMMKAIDKGEVTLGGEWIVGARPKEYCARNPKFHMKIAHHIKEFYTKIPKYAPNYTDFNCGMMAVYYAAQKLKADEINMWGFDTIFDFNMRSYTDLVIESDRGNMNNNRLINNWRPVWMNMFKDKNFKEIKFNLHHKHSAIKFKIPSNVEIITHQ